MKKLLTIMTLALALCLFCSIASATAIYQAKYTYDSYYDLVDLKNAGKTIKDVYGNDWTIVDIPANNKQAAHDTYPTQVNVMATNGLENAIIEVVVKSTHKIVTDTDKSYAETCGKDGLKVLMCKDCDWTSSKVLDKTGNHTWKVETTAANCIKDGVEKKYCTVCGKVDHEKVVALATGVHNWADGWQYSTTDYWYIEAPGCKENDTNLNAGKAVRLCKVCKTKDSDNTAGKNKAFTANAAGIADYRAFMETLNVHIDASYDGHDWDTPEKVAANCFHGSGTQKWCKRCSLYQLDASTADSAKAAAMWVLADTVRCNTAAGANVTLICSKCWAAPGGHHTVIGTVQAIDHTTDTKAWYYNFAGVSTQYVTGWTLTIKATDNHPATPKAFELTTNVAHDFSVALGTSRAVDYTALKLTNPCEVFEIQQYRCKYCASTLYKVSKEAPGHNWSQWALYDDGDGKTESKRYERKCDICEKREIKAFTDTPPVVHNKDSEHVWVDDPTFKFTCNALNDVKQTCACGATRVDKERKVEHAALKTEVVKAATCKATGVTHNTCKNCGLDEYVVTKKTDHTWDAGKVTTAATKEKAGVRTFTCTVCGATKTEAEPYKVTADPKYTITAAYNGKAVSGKLTHVEDTLEAAAKYVRVTFYIGTYYMATTAEVEADGTYAVEGVGPIDYITVVPTGNSAVNPDEVKRIGEAEEIFVK